MYLGAFQRAEDGRVLEFRDGSSRPGIFGVDLQVERAGVYDMSQGGSDQRPLLSIFKINVFGSIEAQYSCNTGKLVIDNDVSSEIGHLLTGHIDQELDCCLYENNQYDCDQAVTIPSGEFMSPVVGDDFVP